MKLAASDLVLLAAQAGFTDLSTAAAVALAESGGNPQAFNPEGSYGLWQIYLPDHPEFAGVDLTDPATNAAAAFRVYANAGYKFTPWSAFKNGAYTRYMSSAQAAVSQLS
jgi:soluble lytic murein transglycosylase-like protein